MTLTDRKTLLATILEHPDDDTARLVLADLLRESEDADEQARGRFLWGGITAASYRDEDVIEDRLFYTAQAEFEAVASSGLPARWLSSLGIGPTPLTNADWGWDNTHDRVTVRVGAVCGVFTRGLLSELSLTLGEWWEVGRGAVAAWPIVQVAIRDIPGLTFAITKDGSHWRLTARLRVPGRRTPHRPNDWHVEKLFATREALVESVAATSSTMVTDLREVVGDRWPSPPRRRR